MVFISNEFIFKSILSRMIIIKNDSFERKDYGANLAENNNKNDLYYIIASTNINEPDILRSYIYKNINKSKQNLYLKLIFAIYNLSNNNVSNKNSTEDYEIDLSSYMSDNSYDDRKLLNNWDNPDFSLLYFLLFFYDNSSHIVF